VVKSANQPSVAAASAAAAGMVLPEGAAEAEAASSAAAAAAAAQASGRPPPPSKASVPLCAATALIVGVTVPSFAALPYFAAVLAALLAWGFESHAPLTPLSLRRQRQRRRRHANANGGGGGGGGGVASGLAAMPAVPQVVLQLGLLYSATHFTLLYLYQLPELMDRVGLALFTHVILQVKTPVDDSQHDDSQHDDSQHDDSQYDDSQHDDSQHVANLTPGSDNPTPGRTRWGSAR
jgi:hypothetical protein